MTQMTASTERTRIRNGLSLCTLSCSTPDGIYGANTAGFVNSRDQTTFVFGYQGSERTSLMNYTLFRKSRCKRQFVTGCTQIMHQGDYRAIVNSNTPTVLSQFVSRRFHHAEVHDQTTRNVVAGSTHTDWSPVECRGTFDAHDWQIGMTRRSSTSSMT